MTRLIYTLGPIALLLFACGTTPSAPPTASPTEPAEPATSASPTSGNSADCPSPSDPCMNEDNHAECLEVAKKCPGAVVQLESCPLQFACD